MIYSLRLPTRESQLNKVQLWTKNDYESRTPNEDWAIWIAVAKLQVRECVISFQEQDVI
jgi:hypothetical protein